jgi:hypothetical protein
MSVPVLQKGPQSGNQPRLQGVERVALEEPISLKWIGLRLNLRWWPGAVFLPEHYNMRDSSGRAFGRLERVLYSSS